MIHKNKVFKSPLLVKAMFDGISKDYDRLNDLMTFRLHKKIKRNVVRSLSSLLSPISSLTFLDLCTGTGDIAAILKENYPDSKIIGIDFSEKMLEIAREKHSGIDFLQGDCIRLPFEDESVDVCLISFGLRNIGNMKKTLEEIYRVLKKGGVFLNLDLGKPNKLMNILIKPYMTFWVSLLGKIFHGDETPYKYLADSNETFPSQKELTEIYRKIGFSNIQNKNYLFGQIASQISIK